MSQKKRSYGSYSSDNNPPAHAPFAIYGTPLPAYDSETRDDGSYVPIWKQEVTDEQGRKRLHGAFTGGWSAGYFNTVGSKEGWTPSTFVSSRANRAKNDAKQQRAEDFMDEEDLAEQAESQKLETHGAFAGLGGDNVPKGPSGMFGDLFRATGETMGVKLLQRMGWKPGQGIGPKVRRLADGDKSGELHLFAPGNSKLISFHRKIDRKGLGFAGESRLDVGNDAQGLEEDANSDEDASILKRGRSKLIVKPGKLKKKAGIGIGIGVLDDTGSDDEDPYEVGPQISYNRVIGGDKKKNKGFKVGSTTNASKPGPSFVSRKPTQSNITFASATPRIGTGFRKCHDGRLPLHGFVLSSQPLVLLQDNKHLPPEVPEGWISSKSTEKPDATNPYQSTADIARASTLDPKSRAALLGEQQLPGKSVFDFLSPAARDKLVNATGKENLPRALGEGAPAGFEASESEKRRTLWDLVPPLAQDTAQAALRRGTSGWMPYAEDETKRARYRCFLELRSGHRSNLPERPKGFSIDDWAQEMREFAQAAEVFKPISGLMATRFTSSTSAPKLASDAPEAPPSAAQKKEDPAEKAAKLGMYGPLTRARSPFYPTRLLCKRFNVRPPANMDPGSAPHGDIVPESKRLDVVSQASLDRMMMHANVDTPRFVTGSVDVGESSVQEDVPKALLHAKVDAEVNVALEAPRAEDDLFKAVFGDDSDDE